MTSWEQNEIFRRLDAINNNIEKLVVKTEQENRLMSKMVELMELKAYGFVSHVIGDAIEKLDKPEIADAINGVSAVPDKDRVAEQRKKMDQLIVSHVIGDAIEKLDKPEIADAINGVSAVPEKVAEQRKKMDSLKDKFAEYREQGGLLSWNEWRKKYKV